MVKCRVLCRVYMFFCSLVYMYSVESEKQFRLNHNPSLGRAQLDWGGASENFVFWTLILVMRRQTSSFADARVRSCGDRHQVLRMHALGHAEAYIKFGGDKR